MLNESDFEHRMEIGGGCLEGLTRLLYDIVQSGIYQSEMIGRNFDHAAEEIEQATSHVLLLSPISSLVLCTVVTI